jgi:hypothetical protein
MGVYMDAISKHLVGVLREGTKEILPDMRNEDVLVDGRSLKPSDKIYDLVEIIDEQTGAENKQEREIIVIDGRVYERVWRPGDEVHDMLDTMEKGSGKSLDEVSLNAEIIKRVAEITERIAKDMIPEIAERVIKNEIDKLKR